MLQLALKENRTIHTRESLCLLEVKGTHLSVAMRQWSSINLSTAEDAKIPAEKKTTPSRKTRSRLLEGNICLFVFCHLLMHRAEIFLRHLLVDWTPKDKSRLHANNKRAIVALLNHQGRS